MRDFASIFRAALATTASCLLLAACSNGGNTESAHHLKRSLCGTDISTRALQKMYPGPYVRTKMLPSRDGGIDGIAEGNSEGYCDIWITQKKGKIETTQKVLVQLHPRESVDDLFDRYKKIYIPDHSKRLTLGPAKGFTKYNGSLIVFDCRDPKERTSENNVLGVSVIVFLPDHPSGSDVDRSKLSKGAANLAADTARYVSSTVLRCASPRIPESAPTQTSTTS